MNAGVKDLGSVAVAGGAPRWGPWESLPQDILGSVLRLLPRVADRASLRSVCRAWRAAARAQRPLLPPPLPLLALPSFHLSPQEAAAPAPAPYPLPPPVEADDLRCVGTFERWLVAAPGSSKPMYADGACFLLNAFSQDVVRLPQRCELHFHHGVPVLNSSARILSVTYHWEHWLMFTKVILSAAPDSGTRFTVAAITACEFALWRPGMTSWCLCDAGEPYSPDDIVFYNGKLYCNYGINIQCVELEEDNKGRIVSRAEELLIEPLPLPSYYTWLWKCNLVEWRGKLLLVIRFAGILHQLPPNIVKVGVFVLDFTTYPHRFTEINSLDGDSLFVSSCSSKSFPASQYGLAGADFVYFAKDDIGPTRNTSAFNVLAHNVRDSSMATFSVDVPEDSSHSSDHDLIWFFPPE